MMGFLEYVIAYQELLGFVAAGLSAISFLPQLIKIWRFRSVKDISTGMYVIYAVSVILWLIYGIIIKSEPLILAERLTLILVSVILTMKYLWTFRIQKIILPKIGHNLLLKSIRGIKNAHPKQ